MGTNLHRKLKTREIVDRAGVKCQTHLLHTVNTMLTLHMLMSPMTRAQSQHERKLSIKRDFYEAAHIVWKMSN